MKILRWVGLFLFFLLSIGALLSLFTPLLPHPRDLPFSLMVLISAPLIVYFAVEVFSLIFEAIGITKREMRRERNNGNDPPKEKPKPRS